MNVVYQSKKTLSKAWVMLSFVALMWISMPQMAMATQLPTVQETATEVVAQDIDVENWMIDAAFWQLTEQQPLNERALSVENWMLNPDFGLQLMGLDTFPVAEWMLDSYYWEINGESSIAEQMTQTIEIKDWMLSPDFWRL